LRTAIPFIAIGFLLEMHTQQISSIEIIKNKNLYFLQNLGFATIIVCVAEGGQFLIHERNPDLMDVLYGVLGSSIGSLVYNLFKRLRNA
jgi:glycopeptide antibiotics resistance protein